MRSILRYRLLHILGLMLFLVQMMDARAIYAGVTQSKYLICPHTKAKFIRGTPCPCGHEHSKSHKGTRIVDEHADCNDDEDGLVRTPAFEAFIFIFDSEFLPRFEAHEELFHPHTHIIFGLEVPPPDAPS
ncbi:MAG TPA: hypothetical protein PLY93_08040 [Turneriella sp.]|nr:hypothetical protein [Turneriella sp.]